MKVFILFFLSLFYINTAIVHYDGDNYSKNEIENLLKGINSEKDIKKVLESYIFEEIKIVNEKKKVHVYLKDCYYIRDVVFRVFFKEKNLLRYSEYSKNSFIFKRFFYKRYLENIKFFNNKSRNKGMASKNEIAKSLDLLKFYFIFLGYKDVTIGYEILKNSENENVIYYYVNLPDLKSISIDINESDFEVKREVKSQIPYVNDYLLSFYENFKGVNFIAELSKYQMLINLYKQLGYYDVFVNLIYDKNENRILYDVFKGDLYGVVFNEKSIIYRDVDIKLDEFTLNKIKAVLAENIFNNKKILIIKNILDNYYYGYKYDIIVNLEDVSLIDRKNKFIKLKIIVDSNIVVKKIISDIEISGLEKFKYSTVVKYLYKKRGDFVSIKDLQKIEASISSLFKSVKCDLINKGKSYILKVNVVENQPVNLGAGSGSDSDNFLNINLPYRGIFGTPCYGKFSTNFKDVQLSYNRIGFDSLVYGVEITSTKSSLFDIMFIYDIISFKYIYSKGTNKNQFNIKFKFFEFDFLKFRIIGDFGWFFEEYFKKQGVQFLFDFFRKDYILFFVVELINKITLQFTYNGNFFYESFYNHHSFYFDSSKNLKNIFFSDSVYFNLKITHNFVYLYRIQNYLAFFANLLTGLIINDNGDKSSFLFFNNSKYFDSAIMVGVNINFSEVLKSFFIPIPYPIYFNIFYKIGIIDSNDKNKESNGLGYSMSGSI